VARTPKSPAVLASRERIRAGRADLEAAENYRRLAELAETPEKRAELLTRAIEAAAMGRAKLRGVS
jgi:hypothetical protein